MLEKCLFNPGAKDVSRPSLGAWNPIESGNLSIVGLRTSREFADPDDGQGFST